MIESSMAAAAARLVCSPRRCSAPSAPRLTTTPLAPTMANLRKRREKNGPSRRRRIGGSKLVNLSDLAARLSMRRCGRDRLGRRSLEPIELDVMVLVGKLGQGPVAGLGFFEHAVQRVIGFQCLVEPPIKWRRKLAAPDDVNGPPRQQRLELAHRLD